MNRRYRTAVISIWLSGFLLLTELLPVGDVIWDPQKAHADSANPVSVTYSSSTKTVIGSYTYDVTQTETTDLFTIQAPAGYVIDTVTVAQSNGTTGNAVPASGSASWKGQAQWTGQAVVPGISKTVTSKGNNTAQGYWAWYRYTVGDPNGPYWYADLSCDDGSSHRVQSASSVKDPDYPSLPYYPAFDSTTSSACKKLRLNANIVNGYTLNGTPINDSSVDPNTLRQSATPPQKDIQTPIDGPDANTGPGTTDPDRITSAVVTKSGTSSKDFYVDVTTNFNATSKFAESFSLPGAAMMVYYYAFLVDVDATTYEFNNQLTVNFVPAPTTADLGNITLKATDACFTPGQAEKLTFTFQNYGSQDVTQPITAHVLVDGAPLQDYTYNSGLAVQQIATGSFTYTFSSTTSKSFTVKVDPALGEANTSDNTVNFPITPSSSCGGGGGPEVITGSLSVDLPTVKYGESDTIRLANVSVSGGNNCRLQSGTLVFTQGSYSKSYSLNATGDFSQAFVASPYNGFGAGSISAVYKITTTCGTKKDIGPGNFTVTIDPGLGAPQFQASWFDNAYYSGYNKPVFMVPIGETISLGPIVKPAIPANNDPGSPYDPNGADIIYTWNFAGSPDPWIQNLGDAKSGYGFDPHSDHFSNIKADTKGSHTVQVAVIDTKGASAGPFNVTVDIVDPNPVPIITLPPKVVEGRPYSPEISCANSYSPYPNRTIVSCDWHGTNLPMYAASGNYDIQLDVTDSAGMKSLSTAHANLYVTPDYPPVAKLANPGTGLRGNQMVFIDQSYSPDDDPISEHTDQLTCDTNNNGSYADETTTTLSPDASGNIFFTPSSVGNCRIHVHIREGLGYQKSDDQDFFFAVENDQPGASFSMSGAYQPPAMTLPTSISADTLLGGSWKLTSLDGDITGMRWYKTSSGSLKSIPMFGPPILLDGKSPYNAIDLSKIVSVRAPTSNERNNDNHTGPLPFYAFSLENNGYAWWKPLHITKTVDGVKQWDIIDGDNGGDWPVNDQGGNIVMSPDTKRFAYAATNGDTYLKIGDASNGNTLISVPLGERAHVIAAYENLIILRFTSSSGMRAYDWNGNLVWTNSVWAGYSSSSTISKDGYMFIGSQSVFSDCCSAYYTAVVTQVDLRNGNIIGELPFNSASKDGSIIAEGISLNLVGDGLLYVKDGWNPSCSGCSTYWSEKVFSTSLTSNAKREPYYTYGQFYHPGAIMQNGELAYSFKFSTATSSGESAGFSFRMTDNLNFYRVEHTSGTTSLVAYTNGSRTVIQSKTFPLASGVFYNAKIKLSADHIKVYVNGALLIDVYDPTITAAGMYGPYATKANTEFKGISELDYPPIAYLNNVIIVGNPIQYNTSYTDPENDPMRSGSAKWTFTNQQPYMYLNAGDGYSDVPPANSYNHQVITTPNASINKVGYFKVDYQAADDPSPWPYTYADGTFSSYSKYSDPYTQYAKAVRVPIVNFIPFVNPDHSLGYTDQSYDPDRCYNTENCQAGYGSNRGILDRRWKYTAPDGTTSYGFPTRPSQSGFYVISEAVMQEDGVWSDWYDQTVNVAIPVPNQPPAAILTFPNGTQASPSYVGSLTPTIAWNQTDPDPGTTFAAFQVVVRDPLGNLVIDSAIQPQATDATAAQWTVTNPLTIGRTYQVQVRVFDGIAWSAWSNIGWFVTNRPPSAGMTYPSGTPESPTIVASLRPAFSWSQSDPDPGTTFAYFELQVWNENNETMLLTSGQHWQGTTSSAGSWTAETDLPAGQKLRVRVRVFDGSVWSDWSPDAWFLINRPPLADFDWQPKPTWEGDNLRFTNRSQDPDGDPLMSTWQIRLPDGSLISCATQDATGLPPALPGTYDVTLTVTDGFAAASVTKAIVVAPLTIDAEVTYTPEWLAYHERHGHQTVSDPKDFYSGEIFVVRAVSSPVPVSAVQAWIDTLGKDDSVLQANAALSPTGIPYHYAGELFNQAFQSLTSGLPEGIQMIHFRIRYANGVDRTQDIPVNIIGPVLETVGVHRRR
jgi:hypothetical protein